MPLPALKNRFGAFGDMLYRHANGLDNSPVTPPGEVKSIGRETTFEEDTYDIRFWQRHCITMQKGSGLTFEHSAGKQSVSQSK